MTTTTRPVENRRATGATARPARPSRLYAIDLLRFIAAMSVVGYHVLADTHGAWGTDGTRLSETGLNHVFRYGWLGVELFFLISGFVICMSSWGRTVSQFFISRVTRLMPAYIFAVLFTSAVLFVLPLPDGRPPVTKVVVNMTMLQGFVGLRNIDDVYWTLLVELKFYLLFLLVVYRGVTYRRVVWFCVGWTLAYLFADMTHSQPLALAVVPTYAPYFVAGIALYLIHRFGPNLLSLGILAVSAAMALYSLSTRIDAQNAGRPAPIASLHVGGVIVACFFAVMLAVALGKFGWLRWRGLATLGALTYPVYLLHRELSLVVIRHLHAVVPCWWLVAGIVAGALLLAYAVHRLVERPGARVVRRQLEAAFAQVRATEADGASVDRG